MWALRRASIHLSNRGLSSGTARICFGKSEIGSFYLENHDLALVEPQDRRFDGLPSSTRFYNTSFSSSKSHREVRSFSSQPGAKNNGEEDDDLEYGFSELETPHDWGTEAMSREENDNDPTEEEVVADDIVDEPDALRTKTETDVGKKKLARSSSFSAVTQAILASPALPVSEVLDKWVREGNKVTQTEMSLTMLHLRKRRLFVKALQLSEWVEAGKHLEFTEPHYASRVDLIAKTRGVDKAENYLCHIPKSFRGELVYRSLLANFVSATNVKKSEELFNKMKNLGFPIKCFSCDQLLLLYKRTDKKKIADVLLLMEKENIKPSLFTYQVLIDVKGQSNDIAGMEQMVEKIKAEGLEPNTQIQASLAKYYALSGLKDKAEAVLKEIEGGDLKKNRWACRLLLPIYASLGRADEVDRIWKVCEPDPRPEESVAVIEAWGQLKKIEKAEEAFDQMLKKVKNPSAWHFSVLLKVYANHKMLEKGKTLLKRIDESGCRIGPQTWDALVKLYVECGEVEKAELVLKKAAKQRTGRPLFLSYLSVMDNYASRGDVHNAEKIFLMMREAGYTARLKQYKSLLQAYVNAKVPAYGFSDRMKADNIFPNRALAGLLARADAFRKSDVDELLE